MRIVTIEMIWIVSMQIRGSGCFRVLVMLHCFNFLQVDGRVLRENLHIVQNLGTCLALMKRLVSSIQGSNLFGESFCEPATDWSCFEGVFELRDET